MLRHPILTAALAIAPTAVLAQDAAPAASTYHEAVAARRSGNPARAVRLLERWLAEHPGDHDARVHMGYALLALGRNDEAALQFRTVLSTAPDYSDARQGLDLATARRSEGFSRAVLRIEGAIANVDAGLPGWREANGSATIPVGQADSLSIGGAWYRRFDREDTEISASYTHRADADTWIRGGIGAAFSANFRPKAAMSVGADHRISGGPEATIASFDVSWRKFPLQDVWTFSPGISQYFAGGKVSATLRADAVAAQGDTLRLGGSARFDLYPSDRARIYGGGGFGPDTELGIVTDTATLFGGGELPITDTFSITASASREWRDGPADRTEARLGMKVRL